MNIISTFNTVRDIPYRIPLSPGEEDFCCNGKHIMLKKLLSEQGHEVRYRVCSFLWSSLDLPSKVSSISHDDNATHLFLEVMINSKWVIIDASWDIGLKNILKVNEWDGKSNTEIGVTPIKIFAPQKSTEIMDADNNEASVQKDLEINGEFYKAFNDWLDETRKAFVSE